MILLIIGSGREIETIKNLVRDLHLEERVRIYPKMPFEELRQYTANVDLGLSLDKPLHLNYTLSLPNKLFDYIHAGVPVLVSDLPELRRVVNEYHVGWIAPKVEPEVLANEIARALASKEYDQMKRNCLTAREKLNWQQESQILRRIYTSL
jgi:glycosyltransferase involved in cell wall biosynthesis